MRIAQTSVTTLADAMITHLLLRIRDAGIASRSCQTVASMPVGMPSNVVIKVLYPRPLTIVDENVIRPPLGIF